VRLRTDGITWQEIDGELVILDLNRSTYLTTNASGTFLAKHLVEERTRDELVAALEQEFSIERERAESDVDAFVGALGAKQLLA
jgi:hypothetical protein